MSMFVPTVQGWAFAVVFSCARRSNYYIWAGKRINKTTIGKYCGNQNMNEDVSTRMNYSTPTLSILFCTAKLFTCPVLAILQHLLLYKERTCECKVYTKLDWLKDVKWRTILQVLIMLVFEYMLLVISNAWRFS